MEFHVRHSIRLFLAALKYDTPVIFVLAKLATEAAYYVLRTRSRFPELGSSRNLPCLDADPLACLLSIRRR